MDSPVCKVPGCESPATLRHTKADGTRNYRGTCWAHSSRAGRTHNRSSSEPCDHCGWNEAPCDRHRLQPVDGYVEGNVVVLCPNCHREIHFWGEHLLDLEEGGA